MSAPAGYQLAEPTREVRLGLVLYGGVSLAIYINGVTREFFRASRGQGVYTLIKGLTDSDIVVDIVSGASAGGINGIFLGYSLCNGADFAGFASLWREVGDISKLMRVPDRNPENCTSLLDSQGYYQPKLADAFRGLKSITAEPYERVTPVKEFDLFVASTDIYGDVNTVFDDSGDPIDVKNHRAMFQLKHREGRKCQFAAGSNPEVTYQSLAKLGRATSAFPAAFEPVHVANEDPKSNTVDGRLQLWGALGKETYFMDGGVLDNKPFTTTIHEIFYRTAERDVERRLMYVEPDPELFAKLEEPPQPNFFKVISDSLIGIPGYQSIGGDLAELNQHNSRVERYNEVRNGFIQNAPAHLDPRSRAAYDSTRLIQLRDRAVEGILNTNSRGPRGMLTKDRRKDAEKLVKAFKAYETDPTETLRCFDVYMRLRRLFYLTYLIQESENKSEEVRQLRRAVNYFIGVLDIIRSAMEDMIDVVNFSWEEAMRDRPSMEAPDTDLAGLLWKHLALAYQELLRPVTCGADLLCYAQNPNSLAVDPTIAFNLELRDARIPEIVKNSKALQSAPLEMTGWNGLLQQTDEWELELFSTYSDATNHFKHAYLRFPCLDAHLYPMELVSDLKGKDVILVTRVSPLDAQRGFSRRPLADKLAGDQFHHFGGFFKRSWRSNDILWGRLDGLCQLTECVFTRKRLEQALANGAPQRWLASSGTIDDAHPCNPKNLFKGSGRAGDRLTEWLSRLFSGTAAIREAALDQFEDYQELLIQAAQWEILEAELPEVAADAIREQLDWNLFRVTPEQRDKAAGANFDPGSGNFDAMVATLAAEQAAGEALVAIKKKNPDAIDPEQTGLGEYFRSKYAVGSEELARDIPLPVLLQIYATGALLVRNCVFTALGPAGQRIQKSAAYTFLLDIPLRLFNAWVSWWRRSPAEFRYREILLAAVSAVLLITGILGRSKILSDASGSLSLPMWAIFFVLPGAILGVQAYLLLRKKPIWRGWLQAIGTLLAFAALMLFTLWVKDVYIAAAQSVKPSWIPQWLAFAFVFGLPPLALALVWLFAGYIRSLFQPCGASQGEIIVALEGLSPVPRGAIAREFLFPPDCDSREMVISIWGWTRSKRATRLKLDTLIRQADRDALPNTAAKYVQAALLANFDADEVACIANSMEIPGIRAADLFAAAQRANRLAELERLMRERHGNL